MLAASPTRAPLTLAVEDDDSSSVDKVQYPDSHHLIELLAAAGNCHKHGAGAPLAALVILLIGGYQLQATISCNHLK
jgi:hypothetical protein